MHHRQRAGELRILKVLKILAKLIGGEHSLVDQAVDRQGADVKIFAGLGGQITELDDVFGDLADEIKPAFEFGLADDGIAHSDKDLPDPGLGALGCGTDIGTIHWDVAPTDDAEAVPDGNFLKFPLG